MVRSVTKILTQSMHSPWTPRHMAHHSSCTRTIRRNASTMVSKELFVQPHASDVLSDATLDQVAEGFSPRQRSEETPVRPESAQWLDWFIPSSWWGVNGTTTGLKRPHAPNSTACVALALFCSALRRHFATAFIVIALWWPAIAIDLRGVEPVSRRRQ